ncbi:MAG TPA: SRPBCC family protein [Solirubrobacterales bacterium]|nr:SRPBCC family protein [Solirubrobacterales bacterium]
MIEFSVETEIARSPADVFAYVTDPSKLATWQRNTVSVSQEGDGPIGVGTRLHEVHRAGGRELESVVEVSEYEPDRLFALKMIEGPLPLDARIEFEPAGGGTHFTFTGSGEPSGMMRLAGPLLVRTLKRQFAEHCEHLKEVLEADSPG